MVAVTEADILATTYDDLCSVYRTAKTVLASGETVQERQLVYELLPCSLSRPSGGKRRRESPVPKADIDYTLFVRPEVEILAGDTLEVLQLGRRIVVQAGRAYRYPSHNEVSVTIAKERI